MSIAAIQECNNDPILKCLVCRRNFNIDVKKLDICHFGREFTETEMLCQMCVSALISCHRADKEKLEKMIKNISNEQLDRYEEREKLKGVNP